MSIFQNLMGMRIIVNPVLDNVPRMQTSARFAELMPPEFVTELNGWMLSFFGTESIAVSIDRNTIAVGPKAYREIQDAQLSNSRY